MAEVSLDSSATVLTALATITTAATVATSIFSSVVSVVVIAIVPATRQAVCNCRTSDQASIFSSWELEIGSNPSLAAG